MGYTTKTKLRTRFYSPRTLFARNSQFALHLLGLYIAFTFTSYVILHLVQHPTYRIVFLLLATVVLSNMTAKRIASFIHSV